MRSFEIKKIEEAANGSNVTNITSWKPFNLTSKNYDYDGKNKWYVGKNMPVTAGRLYEARFWLDITGSGKYDVAIKPSSESISEAIANGRFYLLEIGRAHV